MMRMQELGVVTGETRRKLETLQKGGGDFGKLWKTVGADLIKFSGMMKEQSATWEGKMSTLRDGVKAVHRAFGEPIINKLKPVLDSAISLATRGEGMAKRWGEQTAAALKTVQELFASGKLAEGFGLSLKLAVSDAYKGLIDRLADAVVKLTPAFNQVLDSVDLRFQALALDFAAVFKKAIAAALPSGAFFADAKTNLTRSADQDTKTARDLSAKSRAGLDEKGVSAAVRSLSFSDDQIERDKDRLRGLTAEARLKSLYAESSAARSAMTKNPVSRLINRAGSTILPGGPMGQRAAEQTARSTSRTADLMEQFLRGRDLRAAHQTGLVPHFH